MKRLLQLSAPLSYEESLKLRHRVVTPRSQFFWVFYDNQAAEETSRIRKMIPFMPTEYNNIRFRFLQFSSSGRAFYDWVSFYDYLDLDDQNTPTLSAAFQQSP